MILTATPAGNFGGDIYIKGKYGVEECKFTKQDDDYSLQLNNVGSKCDDAVVDDLVRIGRKEMFYLTMHSTHFYF